MTASTELAGLFTETGVPAPFVPRALARLGPDAAARLREDPWRLLRVPGVAPRQADHFARQVLGDEASPGDRRRGRAFAAYLLDEAARQGHTVTPPADLVRELERLRVPDPTQAIEDVLATGEVITLTEEPDFDEAALEDSDELPEPVETLGLARWAMAEEAAAEGLVRLTATAAPLLDDATIKSVRSGLAEDRSLALTAALRTGVSILRGTADDLASTARLIADIAQANGLRVAIATPTDHMTARLHGDAAQGNGPRTATATPTDLTAARLQTDAAQANDPQAATATPTDPTAAHLHADAAQANDLQAAIGTTTDRAATHLHADAAQADGLQAAIATPADRTAARPHGDEPYPITSLHRLLEPKLDAEIVAYERGEQHPLDLDLLILPDASVLDVESAGVLVEACPDGAHLVLGGEPGALPPLGPGRVLDDLEASETVPVIELDPGPPAGPLSALMAAVRAGELIAVEAPDKEVVIVPAATAGEAVHRAVQLVTDSIPRALGIPVEEIQTVVPSPSSAAALNKALKEHLNPGPGKFGGFDPGDRVVVAAPLPQAPVGEPGTVTAADNTGLHVNFTTGTTVIPPTQTPRLRPGWAVTTALARTTRYPAVVAVLPPDTNNETTPLSRPLITTTFGQALQHLSIIQATGPALTKAIQTPKTPPRHTRLTRLTTP